LNSLIISGNSWPRETPWWLTRPQLYVLVRKEVYEEMKESMYDASPWTDEEMDLLAEEAGEMLSSSFRSDFV
jgi:hypothetical protein